MKKETSRIYLDLTSDEILRLRVAANNSNMELNDYLLDKILYQNEAILSMIAMGRLLDQTNSNRKTT